MLNALAAFAAADLHGVGFDEIALAMESFRGARRRFEVKLDAEHWAVVDDYGHHPTEVRATLAAARRLGRGRTICVFQPHRYSRTQLLKDDFGASFADADRVFVTDVYPASERPVPGLDGSTVAAAIRRHGHDEVHYEADKTKLPERLRDWIEPGAIVLTLGAGDVWRAGDTLIKRSKIKSAGGSR